MISLPKWNEAEASRNPRRTELLPVEDRVPDNREQYLMDLLQFQNLQDLEKFLDGPGHPALQEQSKSPYELYDLAESEKAEEEEEEYKARAMTAHSRAERIISNTQKRAIWSIGLSGLPYGYYMLLRLFLCLEAVYGLSLSWDCSKTNFWRWFYGVAAVVYHPLIPVQLREKSIWIVLNLITVFFYWIGTRRAA
jgi:hypothetical protein